MEVFALNGALFTLIIFLSGVPQQKGVESTSSALESGVDCHFLACYAPWLIILGGIILVA